MDIKILHSWLLDFLDTKAKPKDIAKYLSLCGPSVERVNKFGNDFVYDIEITTNRIDSASVYGIAREASAILPKFGIPAKLKNNKSENRYRFVKKVRYLDAIVDSSLCSRFTAVLIKNVKINDSPKWMQQRLDAAGIRSINNIVDISNYIMIALGQPAHTFDYDKIRGAKMTLRKSKKGEQITTLDSKTFILPDGGIVIEDGEKRLVDLAGIMGGSLSAVDENTKNVLLFVQTYNPVVIRKTSMQLAQRTQAATIFEKGTDEENVKDAILYGIKLFKDLTKGIAENEIIDIYPNPYKTKKIITDLTFIQKRLGISVSKKEISETLISLGFENEWKDNLLSVYIPSFRSKDFEIEEDVLEEVARIYGYHNMPSKIMDGNIPDEPPEKQFGFETLVKNLLRGWGGVEIYTLSLTSKENVSEGALKLKNPLGSDRQFLRTSLMPSLLIAANENLGTFDNFHLFEMSNVYLPIKNNLPIEKLMLAGILEGYSYREAKGIVEGFLETLRINVSTQQEESKGFAAGKSLGIYSKETYLGKFGVTEKPSLMYYEFDLETLQKVTEKVRFKNIPKYPPQIEDITLVIPAGTFIGRVVQSIEPVSKLISKVDLIDIHQEFYTFRIYYQDPNKTLTDKEVESIHDKILTNLSKKFGIKLKN